MYGVKKGESKVVPVKAMKTSGEWWYNSTRSSTRRFMGVSSHFHNSSALAQGEIIRGPIEEEIGWTPEPIQGVENKINFLRFTGIEP